MVFARMQELIFHILEILLKLYQLLQVLFVALGGLAVDIYQLLFLIVNQAALNILLLNGILFLVCVVQLADGIK